MPGAPKFARDVFVNVVANLVAAAIIYLLGVIAGLFPRSPGLVFAATLVLLVAAGLLAFVGGLLSRGHVQEYFIGTALLVLGIAEVIAPFVRATGLDLPWKGMMPMSGVVLTGLGMLTVVATYRLRRYQAAKSASAPE